MKISERAMSVAPSPTLAVTAKAAELQAKGVDVIGFGAGEPDFDTPQYIKDAAIKALMEGKTKYTPTAGITELRRAIADKLRTENNLNYTPDQIVVNIGGKHSVYEAIQATVDPGDEVLLPAPYWVTYPEAIKLAGGKVKIIQTDRANDYKVTPDQLAKAITKKTVMFILNSPNNPGGFTYAPEELRALAKVLEGTGIWVLSDEIYEKLVYGQTKFISFAAISEDTYNRTLTLNGFSKAFSMTGWRLGYVGGPVDVIKAISRLQDHMTSNAVTFAQYAAVAALGPQAGHAIESMRRQFEKRGAYMAERLNSIKGVYCPQPTGAFYCFPDVSAHYGRLIKGTRIDGSLSFASALLEQANVAVVPGLAFGCDKNIRLSFACSMDKIEAGMDRLARWLES